MEASVAANILEVDALMEDGAPEPTMINSVDFDLNKFQALIGDIPNDFEAWTSLITHVEKTHPSDIERICLIYDAFLSEYPLCYGYWNKYASHKARLCTLHEVEEIFERAAQAVPYSVDLWVSYCSFGALAYEDANDIRRLYERGLSFVKKDYLCHQLWDKYIDFEHSLKKWRNLAHLFIRILVFPSRKLQSYYERFKRLVHIWSQEIGYQDEPELPTESIPYSHGLTDIKDTEYAEISNLIKDFMDQPGILSKSSFRKYLFIGEQFYHRSRQIDEKISCFESQIRRRYFHVKPLDAGQLDNWHQYLDFVEMQGDFDWTVKLYERCLIACANYSDFWMRYVEYVEAMGGREIANHALARAATVFLKKVPAFRIYSAMFKEKTGDASSARALFIQKGMDLASNFIEAINRKANMEKRMGNTDAAYLIYEKSIELAKVNGNLEIIPNLYNNFARFTFVASGSIDAARGVFLKGIQELPCKSILEGLIQFTTIHGGALEVTILDTIIANALEPGSNVFQTLSSQDREDISRLFLEFVDLHGNIHEIRQAWDRHWKLFPHIMRPQLDYAYTENSSREKCMSARNGIVTAVTCNGCFDNNKLTLDMQQTKQSSVQCNDDILSESDATGGLHLDTNKGIQEKQEQLTDAKQPEQPLVEQNELHDARNEQIHESPDVTQEEKVSLECAENKNSEPKHDLDENTIPSSLDNLSINSPDTKSQQLTSITLVDSKLVQEVNTILSGSKSQEAFGVHKPIPLDTKSGTCSKADIQNEGSNLYHHTKSPAIVAQSKFQQQSNTQSHSNSRHDSPISTASPQIGSSGGSWTQMNHGKHPPEDVTSAHQNIPELQSQQCQVNAQMQYPSAGTSSQVLVDQSHPFQSQVWTSIQGQQANQPQILYQMAAAQPYQTANYAWVGQNMQHQGLVYVHPQPNPQPSSQAQTLVYQQAQQNNEQYGYPHSDQVFAPHLWQHYYQQHFYYLQQQQQQQQQQQSQLVHNVSEQPSQSAQAQEHQESHSQQLALQSQQLLLQLHQQRSLQPKQQEPEHVSSPEPNSKQSHQQQQVPQVQQQQAPQVLQQDEHANQTQQQQQLLYLQQQQQQQMYLHQQHLYMQQLLQQQFYQQQQQQAPQQLLQQQHQQLLMQQQQQLFQLPQQQQQGIGESEIQVQPTCSYMQGEEDKAEQSVHSYSSTPQRTPTTQ